MGLKVKPMCVYCGAEDTLTIDHVVPLSRWREFGIARRVLDNKSNRVLACRKCNLEKGKLSPRAWFKRHPEYRARFMHHARFLSDTIRALVDYDVGDE